MKHLLWVVGLAAAVPAGIFGEKFFGGAGHRSDLLLCIVFAAIALYFVIFNKFLGGTVWQRLLGAR